MYCAVVCTGQNLKDSEVIWIFTFIIQFFCAKHLIWYSDLSLMCLDHQAWLVRQAWAQQSSSLSSDNHPDKSIKIKQIRNWQKTVQWKNQITVYFWGASNNTEKAAMIAKHVGLLYNLNQSMMMVDWSQNIQHFDKSWILTKFRQIRQKTISSRAATNEL